MPASLPRLQTLQTRCPHGHRGQLVLPCADSFPATHFSADISFLRFIHNCSMDVHSLPTQLLIISPCLMACQGTSFGGCIDGIHLPFKKKKECRQPPVVENYAGDADLEAEDAGFDPGTSSHLSFPVLLPGRLLTDTKLLPDKLNSSPSQLHYACSRSSAVEEAMPDTLIHALKISAGLVMRVRRQIWKT